MLDTILQLDRELFIYLNSLGSEKYDGLWLLITKQFNWIPMFAVFAYFVFRHLGWRHAILIMVLIAVLVTFTDQTTNLIKYTFKRLRPGSNPELADIIRAVQTRKSFSFLSGHASSSMASAFFLFHVLKPYIKYMGFIFIWPLVFAYSRIYLGLHYPLDIVCGYMLGILFAFGMLKLYAYLRNRFFPKEKENLDHPTNSEPVSNG